MLNTKIYQDATKINNYDKITLNLSTCYDSIDSIIIYSKPDKMDNISNMLKIITAFDNKIPIYVADNLSFYNNLLTKIYSNTHIKPIDAFVGFIKSLDDSHGQIFKIYSLDEFVVKLLEYTII
jgi:hypothetical protein